MTGTEWGFQADGQVYRATLAPATRAVADLEREIAEAEAAHHHALAERLRGSLPATTAESERALGWAVVTVDASRGVVARASINIDKMGRPVVTDVHVECPTGITANDLRAVSLASLLGVVSGELSTLQDQRWRQILGIDARISALADDAAQSRPRRGRPSRIPDKKLRRVAELYLTEQAGGPGMRRRMLRRLRMQPTEEATLGYWIQRARKDGWLTPGQHGQRAAAPGPRLIEYRDQEGQK